MHQIAMGKGLNTLTVIVLTFEEYIDFCSERLAAGTRGTPRAASPVQLDGNSLTRGLYEYFASHGLDNSTFRWDEDGWQSNISILQLDKMLQRCTFGTWTRRYNAAPLVQPTGTAPV